MDNLPNIPRRSRGDKITAEDHNNVAKAISNLARGIPVNDIGFTPVHRENHPFELYNIRKDSGAWDVRIQPGFVIENNILLSGGAFTWTPTIGGTPMTSATLSTPIRITVTDGDNIYLNIVTNEKGDISQTPIIVVASSASSTHHVPPSPDDSGRAGDYNIKIATCTLTSGVMFIEDIELRDNFYWTNQLIELKNVGSEAEIVKTFNRTSNYHPIRTLDDVGTEPSGDDVYDVYVKPDQKTDTIEFYGKVDLSGFTTSHPWKATGNGTGNIAVAAGKVMFPINNGGSPSDPMPIVYDYVSYAGGSVAVSADGFLYVKCEVSGSEDVAGVEGLTITQVSPDPDIASMKLEVESVTTASVVFSTDDPSAYDPADGNFYYPIAEVSRAAGIASVDDQILTHNPTHSLVTVMSVS